MTIQSNGMTIQLSDAQTEAILNKAADRLLEIVRSKLIGGLPEKIPTEEAKRILKDKGYNVSTTPALNNLMATFGIPYTTKGRKHYYDTEKIQSIPKKR